MDMPLAPIAQTFYANYFDEYDFLVFVSPEILNAQLGGLHTAVRQRAIPGTGVRATNRSSAYGSAGRLGSAIGVDRVEPGSFPPLAHEVLHHWAVDFDESLGFGDAFVGPAASHWGTVSVDGVLGGFRADSLRCKTPTGALPPDCSPEVGGAFHYVTAPFDPRSADRAKPFAPLELYLMGLLPLDEVPPSYTILTSALPDPVSVTATEQVVEAGPIATVTMDQVVARHGEREQLPEGEREFSMALVVVTAEPATEEFLAQVDSWAGVFGGTTESATWPSFAQLTGERATMNTCLGARRELDSPEEEPIVDESDCNALTQDCAEGLGCYGEYGSVCLPAGVGAYGDPCDYDEECAPGLGCGVTFNGGGLCSPYCNIVDATADDYCETLCPGAWSSEVDIDGSLASDVGHCLGGNGAGACSPLLQDCVGGFACFGGVAGDPATCWEPGSLTDEQSCTFTDDCAKGLTCVSFGDNPTTCQRYCAFDDTETGCDLACTNGYWMGTDFGLCYPSP